MRLLACQVENFGRLHRAEFDFSKNPTVLFARNGYGKSTLAAFLKCMFYGMPDSRMKTASGNVRLKYKPWQGGVYGGSLTFEKGGKLYLVRRVFGDGYKGDDCKIYDASTHLLTSDFSGAESLGHALFGVDGAAYEKLAYFPQGAVESGLDGGLKNALLKSFEGLSGGEDAERAVARLEEEERLLRAKRRPAKGRLDVLDEEIAALYEELESVGADKDRAEAVAARLRGLDENLASVKKQAGQPKKGVQIEPSIAKRGKSKRFWWGLTLSLALTVFGAVGLLIPPLPIPVCIACLLCGTFCTGGIAFFAARRNTEETLPSREERTTPHDVFWERVESLTEEKTRLQAEYQALCFQRRQEGELREKLARKEAEKEDLEKRASRLRMAKELLVESKKKIAGKYLRPVTEKCQRLFKRFYVERTPVLTADGEVYLEDTGGLREGAYYSAGMRAALGVCVRLALIEALFGGDKPPLILDDPFVDMDEENVRLAQTFVRAVADEYQIVYFTCHESRLPEKKTGE